MSVETTRLSDGIPPPPLPTVDTYRRAADAMRDATKWLVAIVPGAGLVLALAALVPDLADLDPDGGAFWWAVALIAGSVLGAIGAIWTGARVLNVGASGFGAVVAKVYDQTSSTTTVEANALYFGDPPPGSLAYKLADEGVLRLYGYSGFTDIIDEVLAENPTPTSVAAGVLTADFAAFDETRTRFRLFLRIGAICLAGAFASLVGATYVIADNRPRPVADVTVPVAVTLFPNESGADALRDARGCATEPTLPAVAVGGRFDAPELVIAASGECEAVSLSWQPEYGVVVPNS